MCPHIVVESVGSEEQPLRLLRHGLDHRRMRVSHIRCAVSTNAVDVLRAIHIPDVSALTTHQHDRLLAVRAALVVRLPGYDLFPVVR